MMTSTEEPCLSTLKQETKEAVLPWVSFDKSANNDLYKQERTDSLVRFSCCGKIYFHDHDENGGYDKNNDFMSLKPHGITKLAETGRKWLSLGYGPRKKPKTLLLDFTEETSEIYEEWYAFFCEKMGVKVPQRRYTENLHTMKKPKPIKTRIHSAFLPSHKTVVELDDQHDQDNVFGEQNIASNHQQQETCHPSLRIDQAGFHNRAPGKDSPSSECSDSSDLSSFSSLKSRCSYNPKPEDLECTKDHLLQHQFTDYNDQIIVTRNVDGSKLHIGDRVAPRGAEGPTGMNAQGLREYIQTSDEENGMISLSITRGEEVTIREGELETNITFKGSKRPDTAEAVMPACSTDNQFDTYQTYLTIAEIDNNPVPVGTQCDQDIKMMATNDVITMLFTETMKEAEFSYFTSDIKDVQNNKVKRRRYFRALSREKSLVLHSAKAGDECMRYRPRQITRIVEPQKKFLCVEYGPDDGPMYMLLDFNDSSENMDEWESALYQLMGLENKIRERTKSESLRRRPSANKTKRAVSTFQPTKPTITTIPEKLGEQNNQDDTDIEPQFNATTTDGESSSQEHETRDRVDADVDNVSLTSPDVMSPYSSLKSEGDDEHYRKENQLRLLEEERDKEFVDVDVCVDELQRLTVSDYGEQVYVGHVEDDAPSNIHIGDRLLKMDNKTINTAQDAMNGIRSEKGEKTRVPVLLERFPKGNVCVVGSDVKSLNELGIVVKGSEITSTQGKFRRSCDPAWVSFKGERSTRSITAINDHPVSLQANTQQSKRRNIENGLSILTLLHRAIAALAFACCPVLVAGNIRLTEPITLDVGTRGVVPFYLQQTSSTLQLSLHYTIQFGSKGRPFCINGQYDVDGFKNPSQVSRFTTTLIDRDASVCVNMTIDDVDTIDEDQYIFIGIWQSVGNALHDAQKKEVIVQRPPGPADCFITLSDSEYPYEVHCWAKTGSMPTILACYQNDRDLVKVHNITDNGSTTRAIFLLPDTTHFSCCSHGITSTVGAATCNDFEWPPGYSGIPSTEKTTSRSMFVGEQSNWPTDPRPKTNTVGSGACSPIMIPSQWHFLYLLIYLLVFVINFVCQS